MPGLLAALLLPVTWASSPRCGSCLDGGDESRNLLYRTSEADPLRLMWPTPPTDRERVHVFAGNPATLASLPDRGPLPSGERPEIVIPANEVGRGTFIAALVRVNGRGEPDAIVSWDTFRLLTPELAEAQNLGPPPHTDWEIDLRPSVLRAERAGQHLPRTEGEGSPWWSLVGTSLDDLDLDGANTGLPGLTVQVSAPWKATPSTWLDKARSVADDTAGHRVQFGELGWEELPDRALPDGEVVTHFYSVITLRTRATSQRYEARDLLEGLGIGQRGFYAHETSANLGGPPDPRLWAGYSERELSEDPALLKLLGRALRDGEPIPGVPPGIAQADGDGGPPRWEMGFVVTVERSAASAGERTSIDAVDVVGTRVGLAVPEVVGSSEEGPLSELRSLFSANPKRPLDLGDPPPGWKVSRAVADLGTRIGTLPLARGKPALAQRGARLALEDLFPDEVAPTPPPSPGGEGLDAQARFVLSASLRAGALTRAAPLGPKATDILPLDTWAQYVVQLSVRTEKGAPPVGAQGPNVEHDPSQGVVTTALPTPPGVTTALANGLGVSPTVLVAGIAGLGLVVVLVLLQTTGLGPALSRVLALLTTRRGGKR